MWRSIGGAWASAHLAIAATATAGAARTTVRGPAFFSVPISMAASVKVIMVVMVIMAVVEWPQMPTITVF
jgi:hypothetical protein